MSAAGVPGWRQRLLELLLLACPGVYGRWAGGRGEGAGPAGEAGLPDAPAVLVVDHDFPDPSSDAGSRAIACFAALVRETGRGVVFWAASRRPSAAGRRHLEKIGVVALGRDATGPMERWLAVHATRFAAAVVSRPLVAAMQAPALRRHLRGPLVYYGHDIHHWRLRDHQRLHGRRLAGLWDRLLVRVLEHRIWRQADRVLYPAGGEVAGVNAWRRARGLAPNAHPFPLWVDDPALRPAPGPGPSMRAGLLFVGSHAHVPNRDGLDWFLAEVLPRLPARWQSVPITVAGNGMEAYRPPVAVAGLRLLGRVDEAGLAACYAQARVVLAPLRFGAGVKGKVVEALAHGVPCVLTPVAAQGLEGIAGCLPVAGDAQAYARALVPLLEDDAHWAQTATAALACYRQAFDREAWIARLDRWLDPAGVPAPE